MSEDAIAAVRRWFRALEDGDPAPEMCDPDVTIENWDDFPLSGPYRGHDGVRRWWDDIAEAFDEFHWRLESIEPIDGDRCLTIQRFGGRFRHTGMETDFAWGSILAVRNGKILSAIGYPSPHEARSAAGLD